MLRPDTASHLFKVCVLPVLEYGLPIWGVGDWRCPQWTEVESFVAQTARTILGAPPHAPRDALYGDLGWRPVWVRARILASNYWARIAGLPLVSLPRKALAVQRDLLAAGHRCWLTRMRQQLVEVPQTSGFWETWWTHGMEPGFKAVTTRVVREKVVHTPWDEQIREAVLATADEQWRSRVQATTGVQGTGGNKLRTYARFKSAVGQEAYLSANMRSATRRLLCRLRSGVAPLQIELGRRQPGPSSRACLVCGAAMEDEEHFIMACPLYDELRTDLTSSVEGGLRARRQQQLLRRWERGTQAQRFNVIMASQDKGDVQALATYLEKAWDMRSAHLAAQAAPQDYSTPDVESDSDSIDDSVHVSESEERTSIALQAVNPVAREREVEGRRGRGIGSDAGSEGTVVLEP